MIYRNILCAVLLAFVTGCVAPLTKVIQSGDVSNALSIIERKKEINKPDESGNTPLIIASAKGYIKIAEKLLDNGANIDAANNNGVSALFAAVVNGHSEIVRILIENKASIKGKDIASALLFAIRDVGSKNIRRNRFNVSLVSEMDPGTMERYINTINTLLDAGVNPYEMEYKGYSNTRIIREYEGNISIVSDVYGKKGSIVNAGKGDKTALDLAELEGLTEIVGLILKYGPPLRKYDATKKRKPLRNEYTEKILNQMRDIENKIF